MSTPQLTADISIELSFPDGRPEAKIHFNKIKSSQTLYWVRNGGDKGFLEGIERSVKSTFEQVAPLPGKSSAGLARFTPGTIAVHNHNEYPVTLELFRVVQNLAERIMKEWKEMMTGTDNGDKNPS
jgi:hypothetical protein